MDDLDAELGLADTQLDDVWNHYEEEEEEEEEAATPARPPVRVNWDTETRSESGFHRTARLCLRRIQALLLEQRWEEAVEFISSYTQTLEDSARPGQLRAAEMIWKLGTAILQQHPNSQPEDVNTLYKLMKNSGVKHFLKISLEHALHLLVSGRMMDARQQLSGAESWRFGKLSASQSQTTALIQAYRALLDYLTWVVKRASAPAGDELDDASDQSANHVYFRRASVTLKEVLKQPGVWDPFIISYVHMLEFYGDQEGSLSVLTDYAYDSRYPSNPNAHVYLYQHLRKHGASDERLIKVLQVLQSLVPCHELMLELCCLLVRSGGEEHLQLAVTVIFSLLDYSGWKDSLEAWSCLLDLVKLQRGRAGAHLTAEWESRPWWTAYHFSSFQAQRNLELNPELAKVKAKVASTLSPNGHGCTYCMKLRKERWRKSRAQSPEKRKRKRKSGALSPEKRKRKRKSGALSPEKRKRKRKSGAGSPVSRKRKSGTETLEKRKRKRKQ